MFGPAAGVAASALLVLALTGAPNKLPTQASTPAEAVAQLVAADSMFSANSVRSDLVSGLTAMFAADVAMPTATWLRGIQDVRMYLTRNPENATARAEWTPIRAGVSADGRHGFTYGYQTITQPSAARVLLKYVAYWVRGDDGWRVVAYKRALRPDKPVASGRRSPALPARLVAFAGEGAAKNAAAEIAEAELNFSQTAQTGLGEAFRKNAADDAAHIGGPDDAEFRFGPNDIAAGIGDNGQASSATITWRADQVIAASSGDLGVSMGTITVRIAAENGKPQQTHQRPFFTVWRRTSPNAPWRFVIE
jgi:ketosteroid isomerase-like protein